jgi:hypothetical protein
MSALTWGFSDREIVTSEAKAQVIGLQFADHHVWHLWSLGVCCKTVILVSGIIIDEIDGLRGQIPCVGVASTTVPVVAESATSDAQRATQPVWQAEPAAVESSKPWSEIVPESHPKLPPELPLNCPEIGPEIARLSGSHSRNRAPVAAPKTEANSSEFGILEALRSSLSHPTWLSGAAGANSILSESKTGSDGLCRMTYRRDVVRKKTGVLTPNTTTLNHFSGCGSGSCRQCRPRVPPWRESSDPKKSSAAMPNLAAKQF